MAQKSGHDHKASQQNHWLPTLNPSIPSCAKMSKNKEVSQGQSYKKKDKSVVDESTDDHRKRHKLIERERRQKMNNMYTELQALLPQPSQKADRTTIIEETLEYIKILEQTLENLQQKKLGRSNNAAEYAHEASTMSLKKHSVLTGSTEPSLAEQGASDSPSLLPQDIMFDTYYSPNVVLSVHGSEAQFSVCAPKKGGMLTNICQVLQNLNINVVSAHISCDHNRSMYMIQAKANGTSERISDMNAVFKQAAEAISLWITS